MNGKLHLLAQGMKDAILDVSTRTKAVCQLSDTFRARGLGYRETVETVQAVFTEVGRKAPTVAEVDTWLDESGTLDFD